MKKQLGISRRRFLQSAGVTAVAGGVNPSLSMAGTTVSDRRRREDTPGGGGKYNILMIVTDQERYFTRDELPSGYHLPGHERLWRRGTAFENHQIGSCVCTPSRAVLYTGQHIQNNGMFDNTNFPWSGSMSTEIDTIGDLLRRQGYYTAYKGKWHLTDEFETTNKLYNPTKLLTEEMEQYGFSDYMGIGDVVGHTEGGYLHDDVIASMGKSWLRGKGRQLSSEGKPWFLSVNLVNPHDVMFYNTDGPGQNVQSARSMFRINHEPEYDLYRQQWDPLLPTSWTQPIDAPGRPAAHRNFRDSNAVMLGVIPSEKDRWRRLNNYYLNCIQDVDHHINDILLELERLGIENNTIVIFTSDHGELAGAHGLVGKGATAYREQNHVPLVMVHPARRGNQRCKAVTSHVDIAATLLGISGAQPSELDRLPGHDIAPLLDAPEAADIDTLRDGALYNFNMFGFIDSNFMQNIGDFLAGGGTPAEMQKKGYRPDLKKRGAIRTVYDGRYKFSRYFSPLEHHRPTTMEDLLAKNDLELFDLKTDPTELNNLAVSAQGHSELVLAMNEKLNALIAEEVGEDVGQMLPNVKGMSWTAASSIDDYRP